MDHISRRTAFGRVAASMLAGTTIATTAGAAPPRRSGPPGTMTIEEFLAMQAPDGTGQLVERMDCETFSQCHERMRDEAGVWIPELVPVFEKLDAMRASVSN